MREKWVYHCARCLNGSQVCQWLFLDSAGRGSGNPAIRGDLRAPWLLCLHWRKRSCFVRAGRLLGGLWQQPGTSVLLSHLGFSAAFTYNMSVKCKYIATHSMLEALE